MSNKSLLLKAVSVLVLSLFLGTISFATTPAQQYKDACYELYLESLEKSRNSYIEMLDAAKKMKIEKSPWIDSACVRIREINKILGDVKDSTVCVKKDSVKVNKK